MRDDLIEERFKKIEILKEAGVDPYPARCKKTHNILDVIKNFNSFKKNKKNIWLAGRLMSIRDQGNLIFADLVDETGKFQLVFKKNNISNLNFWKKILDRGDFISVYGFVFKTKKREKSLEVKKIQLLTKSLRPLPTEWFGIEDEEILLRRRYLDLILNQETKNLFIKKAIFWSTFREELKKAGFLEVETPVLEPIPGGAEAEPFVTHHNALDEDFYLRISLELSLKKILVGGFEKVFEIGRIFRNEGIDREHLQDYTQLEFYWAYHDYNDLMKFIEKIYKIVIKKTVGKLETIWNNQKINWSKKWPKLEYIKLFEKYNKINPLKVSRDELYNKAIELGLKPEDYAGKGRLIDLIFKKTIRPKLIQPCFLINPPVEIEPLAKRVPGNPDLVERFQVVACGTELGKGFSELNDPIDQRQRFEEQMKLREKGDKEAQMLDEEFLVALEYGMPPTAGFGISERLFAVLMNKSVRECVFFPLMRKKNQ
ncbi:MAG: lysine--tRNA ligase [Patescibacteria group bacterium]|nr:lysine--tRNA ligase [Patescibacteria group bacterium]MCX7589946.1 lysine--tRNA ligase [Patescibacteria group bacterium]MDW8279776.1 lysine--tRNA ligase [bacterium]